MAERSPTTVPAAPSLTQRTYAGLQWTYLQSAVSAALHILMAAVLGRLLTPSAFGLLALANLILHFVDYFARAGIAQAVVQKKDLSDMDVRAAFTLSTVISSLFMLAAFAAAPLAASLFGEPELIPVLRAMSVALLIAGIGAPALGLLRRHMRFKTLAIVSIASYLVGYGLIGVGLALAGAGVFALVAATLVQSFGAALAAYVLTRHPVRPTRSRAAYRAIFGFGSRVSVIGFFEFIGNELDTLVVGRFADVAALGLYNRGYTLVTVPMHQLKSGLSKVLFPALSSIQTDVNRLGRAYLDAIGMAAAIGIPICAGIAVAAREIILVILGRQWVEAAQVVPWLALAAAASLIAHFGGVMSEVQGALNTKLVVVISKTMVLAALLLVAAGGPLAGYGAALAGAATYSTFAYIVFMSHTLKIRSTRIFGRLVPPAFTAGLVAGALSGVRLALQTLGAPDVVSLLSQVLVGALVLALSFRWGPLRAIGRDLSRRLEHVGAFDVRGSIWRRGMARTFRLVLG